MSESQRMEAEVVICGAGISGVAAAYFLAVEHGISDVLLIDKDAPLSLTSDKSTECYRNWWPGPGDAMVALMNRSITLMEQMAEASSNIFQMNQRGYLYVTREEETIASLQAAAEEAAELGAGDLRIHAALKNSYQPHRPEGLVGKLDGADLIIDSRLIHQHFPYLASEVCAVLHVRRAGWLSAQQFGTWMLDQAKAAGADFWRVELTGVEVQDHRVIAVELSGGKRVVCEHFVDAAGPLAAEVAGLIGEELPIYNELHLKSSIDDSLGALNRDAPLVISADNQKLDWSPDEAEFLREDAEHHWLMDELPFGAHTRPEGGLAAKSILLLWDTHERRGPAKFPIKVDPLEAEIALRGLSKIIPALQPYLEKMPKPFIDGGYYTKTEENRPLATPLSIEGSYYIGASSGYGIMAAAVLGELLAEHICGGDHPDYSPAFHLDRYRDPDYLALLENWGESWQL